MAPLFPPINKVGLGNQENHRMRPKLLSFMWYTCRHTHSEVERLLLPCFGVLTVVEVEAVLAFLSPRADHNVELVTGRRGCQSGGFLSCGPVRGGGDMRAGQILTLKL